MSVVARQLMEAFARDTGLSDLKRLPRRYLWTDAFAVCNFLGLYRDTGQSEFLDLALRLVEQVHETLGRYHPDSGKSGWLSGLDERAAAEHPTIAGLRIGKKLRDRQPHEPYDENLEWDRDGQYFHYLTKWMHALDAVACETGQVIFHRWARELAQTAYRAFVVTAADGSMRMYWKMSSDLSRPLVASMGQHDPLDGLLTFRTLEASGRRFPPSGVGPGLEREIEGLTRLCVGQRWATADSLGIGGLLTDAWRRALLNVYFRMGGIPELHALLEDIEISLQQYARQNLLDHPAHDRLAFRELGMSIGLHAVPRMRALLTEFSDRFDRIDAIQKSLDRIDRYRPLASHIEQFWRDPDHQAVASWQDHQDINRVMLATSLAPAAFLEGGLAAGCASQARNSR